MKTRVHVDAARKHANELHKRLNRQTMDALFEDARRLVANRNQSCEFWAKFFGRWVLRYRITLTEIHQRWDESGRFADAENWYWHEREVADGILRLCNATDQEKGFIEIDEHEAKHLGYEP